MTNLIIGCGVVGLTTALELLRRGQHVVLLDSAAHEGLGASFANGGLLTPTMAEPWNTPGIHRHLLEYMVSSSSALSLRLSAIPSLLSWGPRFLLNARASQYRRATLANIALGTYSLTVLRDMTETFGLNYEARERGTLKIFRSARALDELSKATALLNEHGLTTRVMDARGAVAVEPCLAAIEGQLAGAIQYSRDMSGDAYLFCRAAAAAITRLGGVFHFNRTVRSIEVHGGKAIGVRIGNELLPAENIVVATGAASPAIVSRLADLAIKPVKGYSMTYTPISARSLPTVPLVDDAYHAVITPLGTRLRVAGTAEFAGNSLSMDKKRVENLTNFMKAIYPQIATDDTLATGKAWAGLRPVSADGRPYIGSTRIPGLWVNSGHGHLGWTLAAGSARLLADLMTGAKPAIDAAPYMVGRR
ncbi:FAD-dependent oxidoreductase [uncultured Sphingosinicella sp.]|uniref:FAD-dependent oxidoreductase n=1 Tax=uncultured Sphingosinicella sp. TaxID=478748 RepID=UPI0030DD8887